MPTDPLQAWDEQAAQRIREIRDEARRHQMRSITLRDWQAAEAGTVRVLLYDGERLACRVRWNARIHLPEYQEIGGGGWRVLPWGACIEVPRDE